MYLYLGTITLESHLSVSVHMFYCFYLIEFHTSRLFCRAISDNLVDIYSFVSLCFVMIFTTMLFIVCLFLYDDFRFDNMCVQVQQVNLNFLAHLQ